MTFKGIDLTPLLGGLLSIISALIGWALLKVKNAAQAAETTSKTQATMLKLAALVTAMLGRAWDRLSPTIQAAIADGEVTAEERAQLEAEVRLLVSEFATQDDLKAMATILGLPLPGLIAKIASMMLDTFTKAHDPANSTVSSLAFPVAGVRGDVAEGGVG
jgi:hypothetical protein